MSLRAFLFDSAYQVVTWILIALSVGGIFFFLSKQNYRGALWSGVALLVWIVIMLGLLADRYVTEWNIKKAAALMPPTDRPWLNIELVPGGPIYYLPQGDHVSGFFPVTFRVTNTGRSPSSYIKLKADVFFGRPGQFDAIERQRQICSCEGNSFHPGVVFRGIPVEHTATWVKPISVMKDAGAHPSYPPDYEVKHFDAYIGGCISYTYGGDFHGETGFLYEVHVQNVQNPATRIVPEIGKDIPLERLTFQRYFPGGGEWAK